MRHILFALWILAGATLSGDQLPPPSWNNAPVQPVAGVEHRTFRSQKAGADIGYNVLLPPGYAAGDQRYPVVYWLHGLGGNENSNTASLAPKILAAMQAGLPPAIVVFVNGADYTFYVNSPDGGIPTAFVFVSELVPHVDATYRTVAGRQGARYRGVLDGRLRRPAPRDAAARSLRFGRRLCSGPARSSAVAGRRPDAAACRGHTRWRHARRARPDVEE
jgi:endo-1,4-beta-xylanase